MKQPQEEQVKRRSDPWSVVAGLVLALLCVPSITSAADGLIIVSDVDDTVKVSDIAHHSLSGALSCRVFAGMPELYSGLLGRGSSDAQLRFLSGSPQVIRGKLERMLNGAGFPAHELTLKPLIDWVTFSQNYRFKSSHLQSMPDDAASRFILFGDDTEQDPQVYAFFSQSRPDRVLAVYIRRVIGDQKPLPAHGQYFTTAYDVALNEYREQRLTEAQAAAVGEAVRDAPDLLLLPAFQACPEPDNTKRSQPSAPLAALESSIKLRLDALCEARKSPSASGTPGGH